MRQDLNLVRMAAAAAAAAALGVGACANAGSTETDRPTLVVSTTILGQAVAEVVADLAEVEVVMPLGADPHQFAPSARQAEAMETADLLVVNGAGFEQGMADVIEEAEAAGTPVFDASGQVELVGGDPHLWMDPRRMVAVIEALGARVAELEGIDTEALSVRVDGYVQQLTELDAAIEAELAAIPPERRVLVTNHDVLGYFAERFDLDIVGAVVPSLTTGAEPSAVELEELAATIRDSGVPAIFAETTQPVELAQALAGEVGGDVKVVELYTESLGEPGSGAASYVEMMRTNAELIAAGLS
jgi:zinc/manganese transport system substrate-binding protein